MLTSISNRYTFSPSDTSRMLGQGGMGTVYMGEDTQTKTPVAIKRLKPEVAVQNSDSLERFKREAEALSQLNHPNIVKMLCSWEENNEQYLVMEYVGGGSLRDLLKQQPKLSIQRTLYIALDLADALTRAHRLKILHRDIKPENVLLALDGTPRLTDFGMAQMGKSHVTQSGAIVGTLAYLSPEALNGERVDERSDIWSFGITLYEMLSGTRPFMASQVGALVNSILTSPIPDLEALRSDLPTALVDLIYRMLAKDPHTRIPSVRLVGAELEAIIRGTTTSMQVIVVPDTGRFENSTDEQLPTSQQLPPHSFPTQPTPFVGRRREMIEVIELLDRPDNHLVTILGVGGIGKSRLALAASQEMLERFRDGVFFVPLAGLDDHNIIVHTIAEHIKFTFNGMDDPKTDLFNYLREKSMLLLLDNFEHLTDGADFISELMQVAPGLKFLVTSRERLRLRGEQIYDLDGMVIPKREDDLETVRQHAVVELFLQSVHRVVPDFEIDEDNKDAVVRICELVQGVPLGIELAAAWLEVLDIDEIVVEIEQSLDFLETDIRDVPERHRSVRAVFEYSWNLLTEAERDVFVALSVFRSGFEREAAQKVTGASLRSLTNLVNKSLLRREPSGRYSLNKLLRQYAEEYFAERCDEQEILAAYAQYYADFLLKLEPALNSRREKTALESVDVESDNLRTAWQWATNNQKWEPIDRLMHVLLLYYQGRSMLREGAETFGKLAEKLESLGMDDTAIYWRARNRQLWMAGRLGDHQAVMRYAGGAADYFTAQGNSFETSYALNNISYSLMMQGQYAESVEKAQQSFELVDGKRPHDIGWFMALGHWGYAEYLRANYAEAKSIYEKLLAEAVKQDYSSIGQAFTMNNLGEILRETGELARAEQLFREAYDIFESYNVQRGMAFTLGNIAGICSLQGRYEDAWKMYERGYRLNREIGDLYGIGHSLSALGNAALFSGNTEDASQYFEESLNTRRTINDLRGVADSLSDLARVAINTNGFDRAAELYQDVLAIRREIDERQGEAAALVGLGVAMAMSNQPEEAKAVVEQGLALSHEVNNKTAVLQATAVLGEIALQEKDFDLAQQQYYEVLRLYTETNFAQILLFALIGIARVEEEHGNPEQALLLSEIVRRNRPQYVMTPVVIERADEIVHRLSKSLSSRVVEVIQNRADDWAMEDIAMTVLQSASR